MAALTPKQFKMIIDLGIAPEPVREMTPFIQSCLDNAFDVDILIDRDSCPANAMDCESFEITIAEWHSGIRIALAQLAHDYVEATAAAPVSKRRARSEEEIEIATEGFDPIDKKHMTAWLRGEIKLSEAARLAEADYARAES